MSRLSRRTVLRGIAPTAAGLLAGCSSGPTASSGHLFVENRSDGPQRIALTVDETGDEGSGPVNGLYRVPPGTALQFQGVLEPETEYRVRALQPDARGPERLEDISVTHTTCTDDDPADRMDISVVVSSDGPDVVVFECDRTYRFLDELEYVDPSEHRVRTLTGTTSTSEPG